MAPRKFGGAPSCPVCEKSVYAAEEVLAIGKSFHRACFKCNAGGCNKWLDSSSVCDNDGVLYCKSCYAKAYGPKGFGFAGGGAMMMHTEGGATTKPAPTLEPATAVVAPKPLGYRMIGSAKPPAATQTLKSGPRFGGAPKCPMCQNSVFAAEEVLAIEQSFHKACFKCATCNKWLDSSTVCDKGGTLYCKTCYAKEHGCA